MIESTIFTKKFKTELLIPACRTGFKEQFGTKLEARLSTPAELFAMSGGASVYYSASKADTE